jgi:hypothetical protein
VKSIGWLLLAILIAYGCAVAAALLLCRPRGKVSVCTGWCFVSLVFGSPLFIPSELVGLRAACAFIAVDIIFKTIDYFGHLGNLNRNSALRNYLQFLIPFPVLSICYPDHKRRLSQPESPWPQVMRVFAGTMCVTAAILVLRALSSSAIVQSSFALNHAVMLIAFVLAIESLSRALCGLERLAGFDTIPIVRNAYLSRTIAEFWRRYNYRVHDWFYRNVFQTTGGRRAPARSVLLVFLLSGLFHEIAFALATSRLTGYQFAFFTIQGPAALASSRLDRWARQGGIMSKIAVHAVTILFVGVTSVLFFDGVSKIFPFIYASHSPLN